MNRTNPPAMQRWATDAELDRTLAIERGPWVTTHVITYVECSTGATLDHEAMQAKLGELAEQGRFITRESDGYYIYPHIDGDCLDAYREVRTPV